MKTIYEYNQITDYLRDVFEYKKGLNPSYSLRSFANHLGFENNSVLSAIIKGTRSVPSKYIRSFIKNLNLDQDEQIYSETLIDISKIKESQKIDVYIQRLIELKRLRKINLNKLKYLSALSSPLNNIILEASLSKDFRLDVELFKKNTLVNLTNREIKNAIKNLKDLKFIDFNEDTGKIIRLLNYTTNIFDVPNTWVKEFHRNCLKNANECLDSNEVKEREFNSYFFNIDPQDIPKIKESMRNFIIEIMEKYETPKSDKTYQLNLHFFKVYDGENMNIKTKK